MQFIHNDTNTKPWIDMGIQGSIPFANISNCGKCPKISNTLFHTFLA